MKESVKGEEDSTKNLSRILFGEKEERPEFYSDGFSALMEESWHISSARLFSATQVLRLIRCEPSGRFSSKGL